MADASEMDFKCPLCESLFDSKGVLEAHLKEEHTTYYYDTYLLVPMLLNDVATIGTTAAVINSQPVTSELDGLDAEGEGCCSCFDDGGGDGDAGDLCGCGDCCCCGGIASCLDCGDGCGLCSCGDCCDCGDCIGCGDCPSCDDCCSFDCSIM